MGMPRPVACVLLVFGLMLSTLATTLAYARRVAPRNDWILYTTPRLNTPTGRELYAVLPDGTHARWLMTISTDSSLAGPWIKPGWVAVQTLEFGNNIFSVTHLNGHSQALLTFKNGYASTLGLSENERAAYLYLNNFSDHPAPLEVWRADLETGENQLLDLPIAPLDTRYQLDNATFILWSDGDFYRLNLDHPSQLTRLTTRGDISTIIPAAAQDGWIYFYTNSSTPSLYRMQPDGSDEALISEVVIIGRDLRSYGRPSQQKIYFWTGDPIHPTLIEANPDGSSPRPIPNAPQNISTFTWSPDETWVYFKYTPAAALYRFNLLTAEQEEVFGKFNASLTWTADGEWLYWVENNTLLRARPDGSAVETIMGNVRSDYLAELEHSDLVTFSTVESRGGYKMYTLDLNTQKISQVPNPSRAYRTYNVVGSVTAPVYTWQHGERLALGGILAVGLGIVALARRKN